MATSPTPDPGPGAVRARRRLYTPNFVLAAVMHFTGGMSTAMFIFYPVFLTKLGAERADDTGQVMRDSVPRRRS